MNNRILYVASLLPSLSETFVYNELFALRARGIRVAAASVHSPARSHGDTRVDALVGEAIPVYGRGPLSLLADVFLEMMTRPVRAMGTVGHALFDALYAADVKLVRRLKIIWQVLAALALARRVRPLGIVHIHAHMAHVPTTIAMYAARQLRISFSFTGHANDLFPQRVLLREKLTRASFVACISEWHRDFYRRIVDLGEERFPVVRCGVAVPVLRCSERSNSGTSRILSVGRLVPKKGFDILVRAVAQLVAGGQRVRCHIIGGGPQHDALAALIRDLSLTEHVELAGPQNNATVWAALADTDLFVLPCRVDPTGDRDGIPVVLMEAMAAGVCVVSSDLPAIRELVQHEKTGLAVRPDDVGALVAVLQNLLDRPELRQRLARGGQRWVEVEFSREKNIDRLITAFGQCVPSEAAPDRRGFKERSARRATPQPAEDVITP